MPYRNAETARKYHREYKRMRRTATCQTRGQTPSQTLLPSSFRLQTAQNVLELIDDQVHAVLLGDDISTVERARTVGFLAGVALRAVEAAGLAARLEAVERALRLRPEDS